MSSVTSVLQATILELPKDVLFMILCFLGFNMKDVFSVINTCRELRRRWGDALNKCAEGLFGKNDGSACKVLLYFQLKYETFFRPVDARNIFDLTETDLSKIRRSPRTDGLCFDIVDLIRAVVQKGSIAEFDRKRKFSPARMRRIQLLKDLEYNNTSFKEMNEFSAISKLMNRHIREGEEKVGSRLVLDMIRLALNIIEKLSNGAHPFPLTDLIDNATIHACCNKPDNRAQLQKALDAVAKKRIQCLRISRVTFDSVAK